MVEGLDIQGIPHAGVSSDRKGLFGKPVAWVYLDELLRAEAQIRERVYSTERNIGKFERGSSDWRSRRYSNSEGNGKSD